VGADVKISLKLAYQAGFLTLIVWIFLSLIIVVLGASEFSARQPATVALDVGLSFIRLILPAFMILLVQDLVTREFDRRLYLISLTYPRPRASWFLGRIIAVGIMLLALLLLLALALAAIVHYVSQSYGQATLVSLGAPYWVTLGFIIVDLAVGLSITALLAVTTTTPSFVLIGAVGFILIARSYMPIIQLLQGAEYLVDKFANPKIYGDSLHMLNLFLPDLGTLDVRMIALYNKIEFLPGHWLELVCSAILYSAALILLAVWRINKRSFT
jgi:ABC-type transport system involved in multi-copper enzyme maturation permease subunit